MNFSFKLRYERRTAAIAAIGIAVCVLLYLVVLSPLSSSESKQNSALAALNTQVTALQKASNAAGAAALKTMYANDLSLDALLPNTLDSELEFSTLSQQMSNYGLTIDNFASPSASSGSSTPADVVPGGASTQFTFQVVGTPVEIVRWLTNLYNSPILTTTSNITFATGNAIEAGGPSVRAGAAIVTGTIVVWDSQTPSISALATSVTTTTTIP
jgi:hypothetical protein